MGAPLSPRSPRSPSRRPNLSVVVEEHEYADLFDVPPAMSPYPQTPTPPGHRFGGDHTTIPLLGTIEEGDSFDEKTGSPFPGTRSARRQDVYSAARRADEQQGPSRRLRTLALVVAGTLMSYALFYVSTQTSLLGGGEGAEAMAGGQREARWSATLLVREPANASLIERPAGYNPLFPDQPLKFGASWSLSRRCGTAG